MHEYQSRIYHPAFGGVVRYSVESLPEDPDEATRRTIERMSELAIDDAASSLVLGVARALRNQHASHGNVEYTEAVFRFVRGRLRFVRDEIAAAPVRELDAATAEVLVRPVDVLRMPASVGDCDDYSMLVASLLLAGGVACAYVTVAADPSAPDRYSHVYVIAEVAPGQWQSLDASHGSYAGWEVPNRFAKRRVWSIGGMNRRLSNVAGLGFSAAVDPAPQWWQGLITGGLDIAKSRFGVPPPGYYSRDAAGNVVSRSGPGIYPIPGGVDIGLTSATGIGGLGMGALLLVAGGVLVVVMLAKK